MEGQQKISPMLRRKKSPPCKPLVLLIAFPRVTVEMKMDFVEKVKRLSNEGLTKMVSKIQELRAQSINDLENDKIQIKIDDFDKESFN